jgi:hypothetical protein
MKHVTVRVNWNISVMCNPLVYIVTAKVGVVVQVYSSQ